MHCSDGGRRELFENEISSADARDCMVRRASALTHTNCRYQHSAPRQAAANGTVIGVPNAPLAQSRRKS